MRKNLFKRIAKLATAGVMAVTMVASMGMNTVASGFRSFQVRGGSTWSCVRGANISGSGYANITIAGVGTTLCFFDSRGNCVWRNYYGWPVISQSFWVGSNVKRITAYTTG